jgi:ribonuclease HI
MDYSVYTDGAYSPSINVGGVGFIILNDNKIVAQFSKAYKNTTNQRMEQLAVAIALESIKKANSVKVYSDSAYVVNTYNCNWKRKSNLDLWLRIDKQIKRLGNVSFYHVKGHSNNECNEKCDFFARKAVESYRSNNG